MIVDRKEPNDPNRIVIIYAIISAIINLPFAGFLYYLLGYDNHLPQQTADTYLYVGLAIYAVVTFLNFMYFKSRMKIANES